MISADKCINLLVKEFFWSVREELRTERFEGGLPEEEKEWLSDKKPIEKRFGISPSYFKSLEQMDRPLKLSDLMGVIHWMQAYVSESEREAVAQLVLSLLPV